LKNLLKASLTLAGIDCKTAASTFWYQGLLAFKLVKFASCINDADRLGDLSFSPSLLAFPNPVFQGFSS
jgi:hypothetical protein